MDRSLSTKRPRVTPPIPRIELVKLPTGRELEIKFKTDAAGLKLAHGSELPLDLRLKLPLERASLDDAAQLGGNLLAEESNVGIGARHANLDFAAGKRRFRKRSRPFESHDMRAARLSHPKHHSLLAQIPSRCVEIDGP